MMKTRRLLLIPSILLSACASQKDLSYVQGEVSQLKQESTVIKQQSAGSYSEITQYREEVASLNGKIDELQYDYRASKKRLDMEDSLLVRKADDLENRIARIEQYLGIETTGKDKSSLPKVVPPPQSSSTSSNSSGSTSAQSKKEEPSAATQGALAPATGEALLSEGLIKMKREDYAGARESFNAFMTGNPKSPKVADAQFFLAETYYNEKWYEKAILEYQTVIARYTKSPKRPAALYKQGLSFAKIGDEANARARYKDVVNLYPQSPEAKLAQKNLDKK
ncbi:tol-pal system protein YbgF [Chlorobaculum sp. MV4-Y]|jgi:tol-pal system protein YbgF|uniref:tol-pal system protein YbgF n=1 Tax=Chlorobaculum sp. MV4-Y TaxID=2976335 RepID=UPI0021B07E50|nr:tol-pal system protein YbgF [Chlorobaculum sp. MV4-Y]UWX57014.1 tol-pal system protein YbgF [Chlorobaculum sp. MV4-Y]